LWRQGAGAIGCCSFLYAPLIYSYNPHKFNAPEVENALTEQTYSEAVRQLIYLGEVGDKPWLNYLTLGLTQADIPELIRLAQDVDLRWKATELETEDLSEWYAQIHAWRALGQLKAEAAIPALLGLLHQVDDDDDDWVAEELPEVFAMIGQAAINPLAAYLADSAQKLYARATAAEALKAIAEAFPERRAECAAGLAAALEAYQQNDEALNGFIISAMVDLKAVEHLGLIERAFQADKVDESVLGDFEDVQVELGLLAKRKTPARPLRFFPGPHGTLAMRDPAAERWAENKRAQKAKARRKQEKSSRRKNRKKKKK